MAQKSGMQLIVLSLILVVGSFLGDVSAACGGEEIASYRIVFQGLWNERAFPKSFPKYRKNAQWSTLTGELALQLSMFLDSLNKMNSLFPI